MKYLLIFCIACLPVVVAAQAPAPFRALNRTADLSLGSNGDVAVAALSANWLYGVGKAKRFRIGYGLRLTGAFGQNLDYITAPAKLTSGKESIVALFTENIVTNLDTIRFAKSNHYALNVSINMEYALSRRFDLGINIDAIGLTVGSKQSGLFTANAPTRSSLSGSTQSAKPTPFNLLLISDSDLGTLNSEAYVRYRASDKISLRGGIGFLFTEYTTDRKLTLNNDRFRSKNAMPMLAISYHF